MDRLSVALKIAKLYKVLDTLELLGFPLTLVIPLERCYFTKLWFHGIYKSHNRMSHLKKLKSLYKSIFGRIFTIKLTLHCSKV